MRRLMVAALVTAGAVGLAMAGAQGDEQVEYDRLGRPTRIEVCDSDGVCNVTHIEWATHKTTVGGVAR